MSRHSERGSATPLLALVVLAAGGLCLGLGRMGGVAVARAQARTAADAAALAGAAEGREAAEEVADANGARLTAWEVEGAEVEVAVAIGDVGARARAQRVAPPPQPIGLGAVVGGAGTAGLHPSMVATLAAAERILGRPVPISSGYRAPAQQQALWDRRGSNPYPVARPGTSKHERGLAIDVPSGFVSTFRPVAAAVGLCQPLPASDPVHFEVCRPSSP